MHLFSLYLSAHLLAPVLVDIVVICLDAAVGDLLPRLAEAAVSAYKEAGIHVADNDVLRVLLVKAVALAKVDAVAGIPGHHGLEERQGDFAQRELHIRHVEEAALCLRVNAERAERTVAHALDSLDIRELHLVLCAYDDAAREADDFFTQRCAELCLEAVQIVREFRPQFARGKGKEQRLGLANVVTIVPGSGVEIQLRNAHILHVQVAKQDSVVEVLAPVVGQKQGADLRKLHIHIDLAV